MALIDFSSTRKDYGDADFSAMLAVWGNGNAHKGFAIFNALTMRLLHAREKHPRFAKSRDQAVEVVGAEFDELAYAVLHEEEYRQLDEALDVAITAIRFYGKEWE